MYFEIENGRLTVREAGEMLQIEAWGTHAVRVRATRNAAFSGRDEGLLPIDRAKGEIVLGEDEASFANGRLTVRVEKGGHLLFLRDGKPFLREYLNPHAPAVQLRAREYRALGDRDYAVKVRFEGNAGEKLYGMGQYQQPDLELKGTVLELAPKNAQVSIPFYVSNLGYGFLWNNPAIGEVAFGKNVTSWTANRTEEIDYWVTVGDTPRDLLRNYTEATGRAPRLSREPLGLVAVPLALSHTGGGSRGRSRVSPPRTSARPDRDRLLPLVL